METYRKFVYLMLTFTMSLQALYETAAEDCGFTVEHTTIPVNRYYAVSCNLDALPQNIPRSIEYIDLDKNQIQTISIPSDMENIMLFRAEFNGMISFPDLRASNNTLLDLYLGFNVITYIDAQMLEPLYKLTKLALENNQLSSFPEVRFPYLENLDLERNNLTLIPYFTDAPNLERLDVRHNIIFKVSASEWMRLDEGTTIEMHENSLSVLEIPPADIWPKLSHLQISKCKMHTIVLPDGDYMPAISHLSLHRNALAQIPLLPNIGDTLTLFDLGHNHITDIPLGIFRGFTALVELQLNHNSVNDFPYLSDVAQTLEKLRLDSNEIRHVPKEALTLLINLTWLGLESNLLTSVPEVPVLNNLETIDLRDNLLVDSGNDLQGLFDSLSQPNMELLLSNSQVTSIPSSVCEGKTFSMLEVAGSLVCDCRLRWLSVATLSGLVTDLEDGQPECKGGPVHMLPTLWREVTLSSLQCAEGTTREFEISPIGFTCLNKTVEHHDLGPLAALTCAFACIQHDSCFMFRHPPDGACTLVTEGSELIQDTTHLYKVM